MDDNKRNPAGEETVSNNITKSFIENDPRFKSIEAEFRNETTLKNHINNLKKQGLIDEQITRHFNDYGDIWRKLGAYEEFSKRHPEDYAKYNQKETTRIYTHPDDDPAYLELQKKLLQTRDKYFQMGAGGEYRGYSSSNDLYKHREEFSALYKSFVDQYPEKAEAYRKYDGAINGELAFQEAVRNGTYQPGKKPEAPAEQKAPSNINLEDGNREVKSLSDQQENTSPPPKPPSNNKNEGLIDNLLAGLNEVKSNPQAQVLAGIDRESFELFISSLSGSNDLTHEEGVAFIESQLKLYDKDSPVLANLDKAYNQLKEYHGVIDEGISQLKAKHASPETVEQRKSLWLFKSKAYIATVVSLPQDLLQKPENIDRLSNVYLGQRVINEDNLEPITVEAITPLFNTINDKDLHIKDTALKSLRLSTSSDKQFQRIILANLRRLQKNPHVSSMGGIPRSAFEQIIKRVSGLSDIKLTNPLDVEKAIGAIERADYQTKSYRGSKSVYTMLKRRSLHAQILLQRQDGQKMTPQQEHIALNYEPEQVYLATTLTSLPDDLFDDVTLQSALEGEIKNYDISSDKNLERTTSEKLSRAVQKSGKTITQDQQRNAVLKVSQTVPKTIPKGIPLSQVALSVAISLGSLAPKAEPIEDMEKFEEEEGPSVFAPGMGFALSMMTDVGKTKPVESEELYLKKEEERERDQQKRASFENKPPSPPPSDTPKPPPLFTPPLGTARKMGFLGGLSNVFRNIGSTLRRGVFTLFKGAASIVNPIGWLGRLSGIFGFISGRRNTAPSGTTDNVINSSKYLAGGLLGSLFVVLILLPTFFSNQKQAAFVTEIAGCQPAVGGPDAINFGDNVCPITPYIIAQNPSPTQVPIVSVTPPVDKNPPSQSESSVIPSGFPITSSCVTQKPGASFSHRSLNAVDLIVLGRSPNDWLIRATHDGMVTFAGCINSCTTGYGYVAFVRSSDNRFSSIYGHMQSNSLRVKSGDFVLKGQPLGIVNDTGFSTANHLHYELRAGSGTQNFETFGRVGTILNFLPAQSTWQCNL